ncbi:nucleolin isoform X1 [Pelobates cultripes]|uniref:Nucleolin n=1 Tax=Pelobates cultripes TaxID=61616 RepID=A0AAD1RD39_PELCU|nr:nucleolin isoform X1 [Pelobates cultripes]
MVKLAKGAKMQNKQKKTAPPPPKDVDDSDEEEDMEESSEEEVEVPVKKTPAKKAATPAKQTPAKKAATPAKVAVTPGKKATPVGTKNGKQAKKQESEDEESDEESEEEQKPVAKKPVAKAPVAEEDDDDDEDDEDDDDSEEEVSAKKPVAKKPVAKPVAKKPAKKEESEDEEDEEDSDIEMEVTPVVAKGKKAAPVKAKEESDDDDDDDEDDDDDDDDEEDDDETVKESGKRKKEIPKKAVPEKKQKTEGTEGLSVFVANLNSAKDFDELKEALRVFFTKKSLTVEDVRIGASKKFGYVEFSSEEEVEKALKFNGKKVLGFDMKLDKAMAFDKNKSAEVKKERDSRTLFVKNIPYSTTSEDLQEIFENAKEVRLPSGNDGSSKGIAYVEFGSEAEADKALEEKQGTEIDGRAIFLDFTGDKSQNSGARRSSGPGGDSKTLVVNNLAYSATEDSLQEVFEKATSIRIPQNNQGRPKGFAFIEFSTVEEAKDAIESLNNTEIEGRTIRLEFSTGGGPQGGGRASAQTKTLFVKGLSEDTTEETLKEAFDGSINARIVTDRDTGASKGFGFVDFSSAEDAKAAKDAMEDGEIDGSKVTLDFAKPKGEGQRGGRGGFGRGGFGGRGGGGRGGFGGRGGGGRGGFGGRGRGGFGGRGGGGFRGGNQGKKIKFDD